MLSQPVSLSQPRLEQRAGAMEDALKAAFDDWFMEGNAEGEADG